MRNSWFYVLGAFLSLTLLSLVFGVFPESGALRDILHVLFFLDSIVVLIVCYGMTLLPLMIPDLKRIVEKGDRSGLSDPFLLFNIALKSLIGLFFLFSVGWQIIGLIYVLMFVPTLITIRTLKNL